MTESQMQQAAEAAEPQVIRKTVYIVDDGDGNYCLYSFLVPEDKKYVAVPLISLDSGKTWERVYYQDIVYHVCNVLDALHGRSASRGNGIVCGTVDSPSREAQNVMDSMAVLVELDSEDRRRLAARLAAAMDALNEIIGHGYTWPSTDPKSEDWRQGYSRGVSSVKSIARDALAALDAAKEGK